MDYHPSTHVGLRAASRKPNREHLGLSDRTPLVFSLKRNLTGVHCLSPPIVRGAKAFLNLTEFRPIYNKKTPIWCKSISLSISPVASAIMSRTDDQSHSVSPQEVFEIEEPTVTVDESTYPTGLKLWASVAALLVVSLSRGLVRHPHLAMAQSH
jgi:hypothetical protein